MSEEPDALYDIIFLECFLSLSASEQQIVASQLPGVLIGYSRGFCDSVSIFALGLFQEQFIGSPASFASSNQCYNDPSKDG